MRKSPTNRGHTPVLLKEAVELLRVEPGRWYVDATVGGGGHTLEILKRGGQVLGIDQDDFALAAAKENLELACPDAPWRLTKGNFSKLSEIVKATRVESITGILFDLGLSSFQLETPGRGFSLWRDEPLDMRMDPTTQQVTAKDLLAGLYEKELYEIFKNLVQEHLARPIARRLVLARRERPIVSTRQLRDLVTRVYREKGVRRGKLDPATKVFQALRMVVNDELGNLKTGLSQAFELLRDQGRMVVISFHEGEDRIVKQQFKEWESKGDAKILTKKPIGPTAQEIKSNPKSRSARLRGIEKNQ